MKTLTETTALVTGASRGIGRGIAQRLAAEGALVAVHYGTNGAEARHTVQLITDAGGHAFSVKARLGTPGGVDQLWTGFDEGLRALGRPTGVDILVNNAGIGLTEPLDRVTVEQFDHVFAVNVQAPFFIVQQGLSRLREGGRIVNISSGVTRIAYPTTIAYSMTKGAINTFTLTLAKQLGPRGITVNTVSPGFVLSGATAEGLVDDPELRTYAAESSAFNRVGQPADIADVVAFIASPDARWITGQNIDATGGAHL